MAMSWDDDSSRALHVCPDVPQQQHNNNACYITKTTAYESSTGSCHNQQPTKYNCTGQRHRAHNLVTALSNQHNQFEFPTRLQMIMYTKPMWDHRKPYGSNSTLLCPSTARVPVTGPCNLMPGQLTTSTRIQHQEGSPPTLWQQPLTVTQHRCLYLR
jgi:hypothetical protein